MNDSPLIELIQNIALLLAIALLFDLIGLNWKPGKFSFGQVPLGLLLGGIGVVLMLTPWVFSQGIIFDTRSILLGISGLFFGLVPTLIAMLITAVLRYYQGGIATLTGISVIIMTGSIGLIWRYFRKNTLTEIKPFELYVFGLLIHIIMLALMFLMPLQTAILVVKSISFPVLVFYPFGTALLGMLMINRLKRIRSMEDLQRNENRLRSLVGILQHATQSSTELLDYSLEKAIEITESKIGYIYIYDEERKELILSSWSRDVMDECAVVNPQMCYALDQTGFWGEAIRQRAPIMLNNFQSQHPLKKGYPEGHVQLNRFLSIPVIVKEHIVAVAGVANKESDYDESDILQLTLLMDDAWKAVQRERVEEALRQSEERYAAIINNLPNSIVHIFDSEFHYLFNAGEALEEVGLTNEALIGKTIYEVLDPLLAQDLATKYQQVLNGDTIQFEGEFSGKFFHLHAAPLRDSSGQIKQILVLSINITEKHITEKKLIATQTKLEDLLVEADQSRKALLSVIEDQKLAEEQIQKLNQDLELRVRQRTAELQVANQELEAFSYSVSHDLRAPLRAMDGFSAALLSGYVEKLDSQGKHYLERIQEASQRMGLLINDLLNLSRVTRVDFSRQTVNLSQIASEVASDLQSRAHGNHIQFIIAEDMEVEGDSHLLKIVLDNLLNNAVKFSSKQEHAVIQFGVKSQNNEKVYFVSDNGVGFDMAYANKLFSPFQRLHGIQEFPGTGIGLVTVQRIIHRHGGRVWPESELNRGATFYFTLGGTV
ncbi:MAG: LytS/YhcK type 5TM receptor domain-containing protein [Anaerolineaceae bacterium]